MAKLSLCILVALDAAVASADSSAPRKIALEEHFVGPSQADHTQWVGPLGKNKAALLDTSQGRIDAMDAGGIDISVLSNSGGTQALGELFNFTGMNASQIKEFQVETAQTWNDELYQIAKGSERYRSFANLPMLSPAAAAKELTRCVSEYGFVGAMINGADTTISGTVNNYITEDYDVLWQTFEDLGLPLYIHPGFPPTMDQFYEANPMLYGDPWGFHESTAHLVLTLMMHKVFERFPKLNIVLGHMGEFLPFWASRIDHRLHEDDQEADAVVANTLKKNFCITVSGFFDTFALQHLISVVGVDRVIYATDYPFENATTARLWFDEAMESLALTQSERDMIEFKNAERILQISRDAQVV